MNIALWVLQGFLAFMYLMAGGMKLVMPRLKAIEKGQKWASDFSDGQVKLIGLAETAGAIGLVLPWATGILPILTPIAAVALVIIMGGAAMTHLRRKEPAVIPIVLAAMAIVVAVGRWGSLH